MKFHVHFFSLALLAFLGACSEKEATSFREIDAAQSGIKFINELEESDDFNIIEYLYFYNGGGVAIGDINNDGFADIYFSSNQHTNKLYLNKGDLQFEDITESAGLVGEGNWKTGVTMADVNGDGLLDIFLCGVGGYKKFNGYNQLFINNGDLTFSNKTEEYKLSFQGFSTQASFFDYDNDGDLDMYLLNHSVHSVRSYGNAMLRNQSDYKSGDKLYRNELVPTGKPHFTEVTTQAGIYSSPIGYGLGISVSDITNDGYLDIYVSNDFHENDYLYINQRNGTFAQQLEQSMGHTSRFSMGSDIADINNDGWNDIITLDMLPADESVLKTSGGEDPYEIFQFKRKFGYHYQFARNALQLNRGLGNDGNPIFSEVAQYSGVEATDWSWSPLLADFDNDGLKDLFVANGIVKRPNDLDYIHYISNDSAQRFLSDQDMIAKMPSGSVANFIFKNEGDMTFADVSGKWLGTKSTLSNGAAYGDLDNDGDLDLVVNNINQEAILLRNDLNKTNQSIIIQLEGLYPNRFAIGAKVIVYTKSSVQQQEVMPSRGWQSSSDYRLLFGLGGESVDSLLVLWANGTYQMANSVSSSSNILIKQKKTDLRWNTQAAFSKPMLKRVDVFSFKHIENDFQPFEKERLTPHGLASQGPPMAIGDVNSDGLQDVFFGGALGQPSELFFQNVKGVFQKSSQPVLTMDSVSEKTGAVFFDANRDGNSDLLVVYGGHEKEGEVDELRPRLYLSERNGAMKEAIGALPPIYLNSSCVKPNDFDKDGDQDLFIGGRVVAEMYGYSPVSYLLVNNGAGTFTRAPSFSFAKMGMVSDASWCDINRDGRDDLIVVGEWMQITVLVQLPDGTWADQTSEFGLAATAGWWNTIDKKDLDGDGDIDFIVGNSGLNSRLTASLEEPVELWSGDLDLNGSIDPIITYYNEHQRYPFVSRDQLVKQVPPLKRKFLKYSDYKNVKLEDILPTDRKDEFVHRKAEMFASCWLENNGAGKFLIHVLPWQAQLFPIHSIATADLNNDGFQDIVAVGNYFSVQPEFGRYDAGYGLVMLGQQNGNFRPLSVGESGFLVRGEGRSVQLMNLRGKTTLVVTRNNDTVLTFQLN